jgi:hypothetical protein
MVIAGLSLMVWGCGSDSFGGTGQGTLQLVRFGTGAEEQPDAVGATGAQIDVCQNICMQQGGGGGGGQMLPEPFTSTLVAAFVVNRGKSDITVDSIQVSYPNSGLVDLNTAVAGGFAVPGGRCSNNPSQSCAAAFECGGQLCVNQETAIPFTMLSLDRKSLLAGNDCGTGLDPFIIPSFVIIRGRDADGEGFAVSGGINLEIADFDNCEQT